MVPEFDENWTKNIKKVMKFWSFTDLCISCKAQNLNGKLLPTRCMTWKKVQGGGGGEGAIAPPVDQRITRMGSNSTCSLTRSVMRFWQCIKQLKPNGKLLPVPTRDEKSSQGGGGGGGAMASLCWSENKKDGVQLNRPPHQKCNGILAMHKT